MKKINFCILVTSIIILTGFLNLSFAATVSCTTYLSGNAVRNGDDLVVQTGQTCSYIDFTNKILNSIIVNNGAIVNSSPGNGMAINGIGPTSGIGFFINNGIINGSAGAISYSGIIPSNGYFTNNGQILITGTYMGVDINGRFLDNSFVFTNTGKIAAYSTGPYALVNIIAANADGHIYGTINTGIMEGTASTGIGFGAIITPGQRNLIVDQVLNSGTININGDGNAAIYGSESVSIGTLTNTSTGTLSSLGLGVGTVWNEGSINIINNAGVIIAAGSDGSGIFNTGTIQTLTNTGSITVSGLNSFGINNKGTIQTLNNSQGIGGSGGVLTYSGRLPNNYNIIINDTTSFGKLAATNVTGSTNFGIFPGSTVQNNYKYSTVLSGLSSSNLSNTTGTYGGYSWSLNLESGKTNIWDLCFGACNGPTPPPAGPSPTPSYTLNTITNNNPASVGAANSLTTAANTSITGLAGVVATLNSLSGEAQSNAIRQTLPTVVGASSFATGNSQRSFNQIIQARQNVQKGLSSGEDFVANEDVWLKGFGSSITQHDLDNVSGFKIKSGGLAVGRDRPLSTISNVGVVFAISNSSVTGNSSIAPSNINVTSYQVGLYGDYALSPTFNWNYQFDLGFNNNQESRNLSAFAGSAGVTGTTARGNYNSMSKHIGTGLRWLLPLTTSTNFLPAVRVDYTNIESEAYAENGAGSLNLNVEAQSYNELVLGVDLRIDQDLVHTLKLSANVGVGYNALNNQVQMTSSYMGGGPSFVTNGLAVSPWMSNAGLGLSGNLNEATKLALRYDVQTSTTGYIHQSVSARLMVYF